MTTDYEPEVIIYPFHGRYPDTEDLYHARCSKHPKFAPCDTLTRVGEFVDLHLLVHHRSDDDG